MGWGSVGFAAGAASVGTLWTGVGSRAIPEPVSHQQPQVVLPYRNTEPPPDLQIVDATPPVQVPAASIEQPEQDREPAFQSEPESDREIAAVPQQPAVIEPAANPLPSARLLINLNTASHAELDLLPGIGPALADRIVTERERGGRYTSLRDLQRVSGIGPRTAEKLEGLVVFE